MSEIIRPVGINTNRIINDDALSALHSIPDATIDACITSPPYYGLRDYGINGQIGQEDTPEEYIDRLSAVFREVRRVLKDDGTLWVNIGDNYAGGNGRWGKEKGISTIQASNRGSFGQIRTAKKWVHETIKRKDLIGIPWTLAFALRADGWYLRQDIIWHKPNPMPESVTDRCTKAHEYIFLLSKSEKYHFDYCAIKEARVGNNYQDVAGSKGSLRANSRIRGSGNKERKPRPCADRRGAQAGSIPYFGEIDTRNRRDVWTVTVKPLRDAHFATFPPDLVRPCVRAGSHPGGIILDPFFGAGTTGLVAIEEGRDYIGIEINPEYCKIASKRLDRVFYQERISL